MSLLNKLFYLILALPLIAYAGSPQTVTCQTLTMSVDGDLIADFVKSGEVDLSYFDFAEGKVSFEIDGKKETFHLKEITPYEYEEYDQGDLSGTYKFSLDYKNAEYIGLSDDPKYNSHWTFKCK
jgi:hypothetical protein